MFESRDTINKSRHTVPAGKTPQWAEWGEPHDATEEWGEEVEIKADVTVTLYYYTEYDPDGAEAPDSCFGCDVATISGARFTEGDKVRFVPVTALPDGFVDRMESNLTNAANGW